MQAFVDRAKTELGRVDFLLANAGIFSFGTVAELDDTTWQDMIDTNLTGVFHAMRAVLPTMIEQKYGRIVATSSMAGKLGLRQRRPLRRGQVGRDRAGQVGGDRGGAARDHGQRDLPDQRGHRHDPERPPTYKLFRPDLENPTKEDAIAGFQSLNPIPIPWVEPIDISNAMAFLCSDEARYITGETLAVAAGFNAQQRRLGRRTTWPDGSKARWR